MPVYQIINSKANDQFLIATAFRPWIKYNKQKALAKKQIQFFKA